MKGTRIAERLLSCVTTPARAASQVGDLLELSRSRGTLWFWRAVLGNAAHGGVRFMMAFASAFACSQTIAMLWAHGILGNQPDRNSVYTVGLLVLAPICAVPVFLLLRFGWRDDHARFSLLFALVAAISFLCYPHTGFRWTLPAAAVFIASVTLAKGRRRNRIPLQSLAQISYAVAISVSGLVLFFLVLLFLWALMCWWVNLPQAFGVVIATLAGHPVNDLINAMICLVIVRVSERMRSAGLTRSALQTTR
ncbi:MAG TPA: hypothetical protein VGF88_15960 [Acidobacteriaceae bacterium]